LTSRRCSDIFCNSREIAIRVCPLRGGPVFIWRIRVAKRGAGRGRKTELRLVGGAGPKLRKPRRNEWTKAKERTFFTALAESCNVKLAAEAAAMSVSGAYLKRKREAAFRAGWAEAIATAYQRLELAMLDRALNGTEKIVVRKDGSEERVREYPNQVAMHLLKMHRDSAMEAAAEPDEAEIEEVRERLLEKLRRLRKRIQDEEQGQA
jgi:hypothetical protein